MACLTSLLMSAVAVGSPVAYLTPDSTAVQVTLQAGGGEISPSGVFVAGHKAGRFRVIGSIYDGTLADTSEVVIIAPSVVDWRDLAAGCALVPLIGIRCEFPKADGQIRKEPHVAEPSRRRIGFDQSLLRYGESAALVVLCSILGIGVWIKLRCLGRENPQVLI